MLRHGNGHGTVGVRSIQGNDVKTKEFTNGQLYYVRLFMGFLVKNKLRSYEPKCGVLKF